MIAIRKDNGALFRIAKFEDDNQVCVVTHSESEVCGYFHKDNLNLYFTEEEVQERIEAAVKEHEQQYEDELKGVGGDYHTSLGKIGFLKRSLLLEKENRSNMIKRVEAHNDELQTENQKLHSRIAELEAAQNPIEVSEEYAKIIEWYKRNSGENWEYDFITNLKRFSIPEDLRYRVGELTNQEALNVVKFGYTIKPDPLTENLRKIIGSFGHDIRFQDNLIKDITEYVRDNYEAKE